MCNLHSHIYLSGILACESDFCWSWRPPLGPYRSQYLRADHCNAHVCQVAKDVRASQETLVDIFERIENLFARLAIYTEVPPTPQMVDIMVKIMVEVLFILGVATKEIKEGRTSE